MKYLALLIIALVAVGFTHYKSKKKSNHSQNSKETIYQFKVLTLQGEEFDFKSLKGKKIMVVNTASKCGLTPQYEKLQALYEKYKDQNFVVVGFPCNQFLFQEPGDAEAIQSFCQVNYGVSFPMFEKIKVKGNKQHPVYQFLTKKERNGLQDSKVKWNFQKYLIGEEGYLEKVIAPKTQPDANKIIKWIEN